VTLPVVTRHRPIFVAALWPIGHEDQDTSTPFAFGNAGDARNSSAASSKIF